MEGEVDARVASPIFLHNQALPARFSDASAMARKRDLPWGNPAFHHVHQKQQSHHWLMGISTPTNPNNWNPNTWEWDSVTFSAKPVEDAPEALCLVSHGISGAVKSPQKMLLSEGVEEEGENLALNLGSGGRRVEEQVGRASKRVRSGSPGSTACYPICQVDDCKADLSSAKDYHRRHKVCEFHSKTTKALVGKQMQRFCQQCSR